MNFENTIADIRKWRPSTLFLAVALLWTNPYPGHAQDTPSEVLDEVGELDDTCIDHGGRPGSQDFVDHALIGPHRVEVWVLNDGHYNCQDALLFPGHWGAGISIYARLSTGKIKKVFSASALDTSIRAEGSLSRIWIKGWGATCGLPKPKTDAEWATRKTCLRPLLWDERSERLVFAPPSEIQFPN